MKLGPRLKARDKLFTSLQPAALSPPGWDSGIQVKRIIILFSPSQVSVSNHQGAADD